MRYKNIVLRLAVRCCYDMKSFFNYWTVTCFGADMGEQNKETMQRWFNVVHQKSLLLRYEAELLVRARELELEDRHSRYCSLTGRIFLTGM